jgi:hypothetical protein
VIAELFWEDRAAVKAFHDAGLGAGAKDNGAPGPRPYHEHYFGAVSFFFYCCEAWTNTG